MAKTKHKRISISLSDKEWDMLNLYAVQNKLGRVSSTHRILKQYLSEYLKNKSSESPCNQLDIFDSVQIDIFNNTSKT